jgi:hypothetical protein
MLVLTLLTVGSLAPLAWADWTVQLCEGADRGRGAHDGRMAIAVVIIGAGLPAWAFTMYYAVLTLPDILCGAGVCLAM